MSKSTVLSVKRGYRGETKESQAVEEEGDIHVAVLMLPPKKRGRRALLGEEVGEKLQMYLHKEREAGRQSSLSKNCGRCCQRHSHNK